MAKIAGLILAAGYSSRMGELKALLEFGEDSVIVRQIKCFQGAGINDIFVVIGYRGDAIKTALQDYSLEFVINENYPDGMFSSVQAGLVCIGNRSFDGLIMMPVDYPLIQPYTLQLLIEEFEKNSPSIVCPVHSGTHGHPPLIACKLIDSIIHDKGQNGLKGVLSLYEAETAYVEAGNDSILIDIDTKQDYLDALEYAKRRIMPDYEECWQIFKNYNVTRQVINHGKKVGEVAKAIAKALCDKGFELNPELIYISGLLHDFKKGSPDHAEQAALILDSMGYPRVAEIVRNHMDIDEGYARLLCNESVLYYADKIVKETDIISLEERLSRMKAVNVSPYAAKRLLIAKGIEEMVEQTIGTKVRNICD